MSSSNEARGQSPMERWVQHILQAFAVIAIAGFFALLSSLKTEVAVIRIQLDTLKNQLSDPYSATEAAKDREELERRLNDHEKRMRSLETKVMRFEK